MFDKSVKRRELWLDMVLLAQRALEELSEDEIQEMYGSDYFHDLKKFIQRIYWNVPPQGRDKDA